MKRILSILLALVMMISLISCGGNDSKSKVNTNNSKESEPVEKKTTSVEKETTSAEKPGKPVHDLSDPRVRKALAYGVDMETLVAGLFEGKAITTSSLTPSSDAWSVDGLTKYGYDPELAKKLLKEANWDYDYELDVVYYYGDAQTVDLMVAIQAYWEQIGVKMKFRKIEGDTAAQLWTPPTDPVAGPSAVNWDLAYAGIAALTLHDYYSRFEGGASNNSHTPLDPELDKQILITNSTADLDAQEAAFGEIQKIMNKELYVIPLYNQQLFIYESNRVNRNGVEYGNEQYNYDWGIIDWTVEPLDGKNILYTGGAPIEAFATPFVNPGLDITNKFLFDRLIQADASLTPSEGMLAESYKLSDDGKTLIFNIRKNVLWHDGEVFDADDVAFTINYMAKVPTLTAIAKNTMKSIAGYKEYIDGSADSLSGVVVDGNVVTLTFESLDPNALVTFSQWPILPKHLLGDSDPTLAEQDAFWLNPIGTGPFALKEVSFNDYAVFERNKDYFIKGKGNIDIIQATIGGENEGNVVLNAEAGFVDYSFAKSVPDAKAIEAMDNMNVIPVDIRYTRLFYVNKFPRE